MGRTQLALLLVCIYSVTPAVSDLEAPEDLEIGPTVKISYRHSPLSSKDSEKVFLTH